eukprot:CAMPEP_0170519090 /NCGR_PEP_ID=MMETSP0209-20121228/4624_1 /TAXON_ID=665100 ORGANISM="Litonotus pictus, Strain P1" /NCGR_SAMPLE_ID=MMETSP0209 /ASSEMBLY_ACC=CAM_ASM_000301 /LENGTH=596 /DNA_ID=CAMNT_0010804885 /DNA_START=116 /DNA_END=1906 /DNA_ORIENTATION=+
MTFLFGKEIYERKIPRVMNSDELLDVGRVKLSEFPIMFLFYQNDASNLYDIYSRFEVKVVYLHFDENRKFSYNIYRGFTECNPDDFTMHKEYVRSTVEQASYTNKTAYCISHQPDFVIQNPYASLNSSTISIEINDCNEEYMADFDALITNKERKFPKCKEPTILNKVVHTTVNYMNSFTDPGNYTHPVVYFPVNDPLTLAVGSALRLSYYLKRSMVVTDIGWILEEIAEEEVITLDAPLKELYIHFVQKLHMQVGVPQRRTKLVRNYLKVQELFAKIGGLFNAVSIICHVILYDYINFSYRIYYSKFALTNEDFQDESSEKEKEIKIGNNMVKLKVKPSQQINDLLNAHKRPENPNERKVSLGLGNTNKNDEGETPIDPNIPVNNQNSEFPILNNRNNTVNQAQTVKDTHSSYQLLNNNPSNQAKGPNDTSNNGFSNNSNVPFSMFKNNLIKKKDKRPEEREREEEAKKRDSMEERPERNNNRTPEERVEQENLNNNSAMKNNFLMKSKTFDIVKVSSKFSQSNKLESFKEIDKLSYWTYFLNRTFACCYTPESLSKEVVLLQSLKVMKRYSFENYLNNNRKFMLFEKELQEEAQ